MKHSPESNGISHFGLVRQNWDVLQKNDNSKKCSKSSKFYNDINFENFGPYFGPLVKPNLKSHGRKVQKSQFFGLYASYKLWKFDFYPFSEKLIHFSFFVIHISGPISGPLALRVTFSIKFDDKIDDRKIQSMHNPGSWGPK